MTHIIVRRRHPIKYYGLRLVIFLLLAMLLWAVYVLGYKQLEKDIISAKGGRSSLLVQQSALQRKYNELSDNFLRLQRQTLLDQKSYQLMQSDFSEDKDKIAALEQKVYFYEGIMFPDKERKKVYLQSLEIKPYDKNLAYQYYFILAQKMKKRTYTKGMVKVLLKGTKENKEVELPLFKKSKDNYLKYGFKYFQEFKGIIHLPEGLSPHTITIIIKPKEQKSVIKSDIKWVETGKVSYVQQ